MVHIQRGLIAIGDFKMIFNVLNFIIPHVSLMHGMSSTFFPTPLLLTLPGSVATVGTLAKNTVGVWSQIGLPSPPVFGSSSFFFLTLNDTTPAVPMHELIFFPLVHLLFNVEVNTHIRLHLYWQRWILLTSEKLQNTQLDQLVSRGLCWHFDKIAGVNV